jgi:hypothetical protein
MVESGGLGEYGVDQFERDAMTDKGEKTDAPARLRDFGDHAPPRRVVAGEERPEIDQGNFAGGWRAGERQVILAQGARVRAQNFGLHDMISLKMASQFMDYTACDAVLFCVGGGYA